MVLFSIDRFFLRFQKTIPILFFIGMVFLFTSQVHASSAGLAEQFFLAENWTQCLRESRRAALSNTPPSEQYQFFTGIALLRLNRTREGIDVLEKLNDSEAPPNALIHYELGRAYWGQDRIDEAFRAFKTSFYLASDKDLFLRAACSLFLMLEEHPELREGQEALISQINTSRAEWFGQLFSICAKPVTHSTNQTSPHLLIRFYRNQISPAIGQRCVLIPSCSEYFDLAYHKHGWLAIPMIADRFIREPDVSNHAKHPVILPSGIVKYRDPIEWHDFWMKD